MGSPDPKADWHAAIACVVADGPNGPVRGTAFLVAPQLALTALHVIADRRTSPITPYRALELVFAVSGGSPGYSCTATWVPGAADARADWALLQLSEPLPPSLAEPLILDELTAADLEGRELGWRTFGFPEAKPDGLEIGGTIRSTEGAVDGSRALQLFSQEAAAGTGSPVSGLSGAPVLVDGVVVGLLRWATLDEQGRSVAGSLFACPVATIREGLARSGGDHSRLGFGERSCPYPGLVSFQREQSALFFGRSAEIDFLLRHISKQRFLLVIGPSGSGKSSLIQAGLLARLPAGLIAHTLRPGAQPLARLDELLCQAGPAGANGQDLLAATAQAGQRLLLFIDQLEELFVYPSRADQRVFCERLQTLRTDPRCILILALRADFFPDLMNSELWPVEPSQRLEVAPLRGPSLLQAITDPAARVGVQLEPALQERLLADAAEEPGVLPLLQETLVLLWQKRSGRRLTLAAYQALGDSASAESTGRARSGLGVAIATHAESVLADMTEPQRRLARRIFLRLVLFGEGRPNTRRQQPLSGLRSPGDDVLMFDEVLRRLIDARLLTTSAAELAPKSAPASKDASEAAETDASDRRVDLAHEVLLAAWPRLRSWISELRQAERTRRRLEDSAAEWRRLRGQGGGLLDAVEVREAAAWLERADAAELGISGEVQALVVASQQAQEQAEAERLAGQQREAEQALALVQERARAQTRLWRAVAALMAVTGLAAALLSAWAFRERKRANEKSHLARAESRRATARWLAMQSRSQLDGALDSSLLLAAAADRIDSGADTRAALLEAIQHLPSLVRIGRIPGPALNDAALSPDGVWMAATSEDSVYIVNLQSGRLSEPTLRVQNSQLLTVAWSSDGKRVAAAGREGRVHVWEVATGQHLGAPLDAAGKPIYALAWSPDSNRLAAGDAEGAIYLWDTATWLRPPPLAPGHKKRVLALAFSPDGRLLATGSDDQTLRLWNTRSGEAVGQPLQGHLNIVRRVAFSRDGKLLASGSEDTSVLLWSPQTGQLLGQMGPPQSSLQADGNPRGVRALAFSPDNKFLVVGRWDRSIELRDVPGRNVLGQPQQGHQGVLLAVGFSPDSSRLISVSSDRMVLHWAVRGQPALQAAHYDAPHSLMAVAWSPDGKTLVAGAEDSSILLFDVGRAVPGTLPTPRVLSGHTGAVHGLAISRDSHFLASASYDHTVRLWQLPEGTASGRPLAGHDSEVSSVAFSPDGHSLASGGWDNTVRIWDAHSGQPKGAPLQGHQSSVSCVAFSPDGTTLISGGLDQTIRLWDPLDGLTLTAPLHGHGQSVRTCLFAPDGSFLLSGSEDETVLKWSPAGQQIGGPWLGARDQVAGLAFSPDGRLVAAASDDGHLQLWEVATAAPLAAGLSGHSAGATGVAFSPDGRWLASVGRDPALRLWEVTAARWIDYACRLAGRDLSSDERQRFALPADTTACP